MWQKKAETQPLPIPEQKKEEDMQNIDTSEWKTYRNDQLGIRFDYPASWGEINVSKEIGCIDYYAKEINVSDEVKDSCLQISLSANAFDKGFFLSTEGEDYTKTDIPKGGDWRFRLLSMPKNQEDFCLNNPYISNGSLGGRLIDCKVFKTINGLMVTEGLREVPFTQKEMMKVYFVRTSHPTYYNLVLSGQNIGLLDAEEQIRKVIETIEFN